MDTIEYALLKLRSGELKDTSKILNDLEGFPFEMNGCKYRIIRFYLNDNDNDFTNKDLSPDLKCRYMDTEGNKYDENIVKLLTNATYYNELLHKSPEEIDKIV